MKRLLPAFAAAIFGFIAAATSALAQEADWATSETVPASLAPNPAPSSFAARPAPAGSSEIAARPAPVEIAPEWRVRVEAENDSFGPMRSDRDYSHGARVTLEQDVSDDTLVQISAGQNIYTPSLAEDRRRNDEIAARPYAAMVYATAAVVEMRPRSSSAFQLSAGLTGPAAFGKTVQNGFHHMTNAPLRRWNGQIGTQILGNISYTRGDVLLSGRAPGGLTYRVSTQGEIGMGTMATFARAGASIQFGSNQSLYLPMVSNHMPSPRLRLAGREDTTRLSYSFFAIANLRATSHDWTLDDDKSRVIRRNLVPEAAFGVQVGWRRWTAGAAFTHTGREYESQPRSSNVMRIGIGYRF